VFVVLMTAVAPLAPPPTLCQIASLTLLPWWAVEPVISRLI